MKGKVQTRFSVSLLCVLLLSACVPFTRPTPTLTMVPVVAEPATHAVRIHLSEATTTRVQADLRVGDTAEMEASFEPVLFHISRRSDGTVQSTSSRSWEPHTVAEMQVCTALDAPCQLEEDWVPFRSEQVFEIPVDWVGVREFWLAAQFRDTQGNVIPSVGAYDSTAEAVSRSSYTLVGIVAEDTPAEALPPLVQTAVVATRAAFPVRGSVEIEGGACCAGGAAGDTIQVSVAFEATSPGTEVAEMRVRTAGTCFAEDEMAQAQWEPWVPVKSYPVPVAINWTGFYVTAQYRDAQGHLSPAYCDDISVEGHPPSPTP